MSASAGTDGGALPLRYERVDDAVVLTIDRPARGNALDRGAVRALQAAVQRIRAEPDLRGVVITGAGDRVFCSGGDVTAYRTIVSPAELDEIVSPVRALFADLGVLPIPVIAAVNGYALGGGAELALACDLRFAIRSARFGFPQSQLGIIPGWGGLERLTRLCGASVAMRLLLSGRRIDAEEARRCGLVDEVVEEGVVDAALGFVAQLGTAAPLSIAATKRAVLTAAGGSMEAAERVVRSTLPGLWFSEDHREAERAFRDKRRPVFRGR